MCKIRNMFLLAVVVSFINIELFAEESGGGTNFSIKKLESQTVLYTVYRGPYDRMGNTIGDLYGLAMQKNITPKGPVSLVYLNNPQNTTQEHILIEIRLSVDANALRQAGTLGPMTDVKTLKASEYAIITKQAGRTDYEALYGFLYERIFKEGYHRTDSAIEVFSQANMTVEYNQMKSEIMVPIAKNTAGK